MNTAKTTPPSGPAFNQSRWIQLVIGIVCMGLIANLQYSWTLFVNPMSAAHNWSQGQIQVAFAIFILTETWLVPFEGWLVDKFGPRPVVMVGGVLVALGWIMNSMVDTLALLYAAAVIAGIGAGCVYGAAVGNALKLFPDKRGLAAGLTAAGFGSGAALTVIPIANMIHTSGYQAAFFNFGIIQGVSICVLGLFLIKPVIPVGLKIPKRLIQAKRDMSTGEMLRTPVFWLIYLIFVAVAAGGLMATAQLGPIAKDYGIANTPMLIFGTMLPLLTLTLSIDNLANGFTRPLCGYISDRIGRENTMLVVFVGEGLALLGLNAYGHSAAGFLLFAPLVFVFWGEIFSIFPSICADTFGAKYATANAGALYTAKGTAALLVPLASVLAKNHDWNSVFLIAASLSIAAALLSMFVLKPMRRRWIAHAGALPVAALVPAAA
jgi:OFA family oxalate/formate antiporter-like MFS transporter